jgi:uncharacterized membrane protein
MFAEIRAHLQAHRFKVLLWGLILLIVLRSFADVEQEFGEGVVVVGLALPLFVLFAVSEHRHRFIVGLLLAVASAGSSAGVITGTLSVRQSGALEANLVFLAFTTLAVFGAVRGSPRVTGDVLAGAIAGYVLLGLAWAGAHALVEANRPHSYLMVGGAAGPLTYNDLIYFSFITMMSIGFGDLVPVTPPARALVICEGITGVAFNTIVLALLVSKYLAHSAETRP